MHLKNSLITTVKDAIADLEPVKIGGEYRKVNIAINRRKRMNDTSSTLLSMKITAVNPMENIKPIIRYR